MFMLSLLVPTMQHRPKVSVTAFGTLSLLCTGETAHLHQDLRSRAESADLPTRLHRSM